MECSLWYGDEPGNMSERWLIRRRLRWKTCRLWNMSLGWTPKSSNNAGSLVYPRKICTKSIAIVGIKRSWKAPVADERQRGPLALMKDLGTKFGYSKL